MKKLFPIYFYQLPNGYNFSKGSVGSENIFKGISKVYGFPVGFHSKNQTEHFDDNQIIFVSYKTAQICYSFEYIEHQN